MLSIEKSKHLKKIGLPQPEFKLGQFWCSAFMDLLSVSCMTSETVIDHEKLAPIAFVDWSHKFNSIGREGSENVFIPSATDILKELEGSYVLHYDKSHNKYCCYSPSDFSEKSLFYDDPADAAYQKYIEIKQPLK